jgi:hypothetical protein
MVALNEDLSTPVHHRLDERLNNSELHGSGHPRKRVVEDWDGLDDGFAVERCNVSCREEAAVPNLYGSLACAVSMS